MNNPLSLITKPRFVAYPTQDRCVIAGSDGLVIFDPLSNTIILHVGGDSILRMFLLYNTTSSISSPIVKTWGNQCVKEYNLTTGELLTVKLLQLKASTIATKQKRKRQKEH